MWIALLILSWVIEGVAGVWFCYQYWMFTQWSDGSLQIIGPGYAIMQIYGFLTATRHPPYPLTQEKIALFFVAIYISFHALACVRGLSAPFRERHKLGVRVPSRREIQRFEQVYDFLARAQATTPDAPPLKKPLAWRVRDGRGMQMRFIGFVLVIDRGILNSPHFPALLAHELAHVNSFDLLTRGLVAIFPPLRWSIFTLVGLPNASGPILLFLAWAKYWRDRVFAADEYAARLGQSHALMRALDELRWALDSAGDTATRGGRWLRETPYIESRIDRLDRYQPPSLGKAVI